jgi:hypothetical protein
LYVGTVGANNSYNDGPSFSNETQPIDPKEQKRQRDREKYAQMDCTKKQELLKRKREAREKRKSLTCNKQNEVPAEDSQWLSWNDNYHRQSIPTGMMATYSCLACSQ